MYRVFDLIKFLEMYGPDVPILIQTGNSEDNSWFGPLTDVSVGRKFLSHFNKATEVVEIVLVSEVTLE